MLSSIQAWRLYSNVMCLCPCAAFRAVDLRGCKASLWLTGPIKTSPWPCSKQDTVIKAKHEPPLKKSLQQHEDMQLFHSLVSSRIPESCLHFLNKLYVPFTGGKRERYNACVIRSRGSKVYSPKHVYMLHCPVTIRSFSSIHSLVRPFVHLSVRLL